MNQRNIQLFPVTCQTQDIVLPDEVKEFGDWLSKMAAEAEAAWMLAHLDDGLLWGKVENKRLIVPSSTAQFTLPVLQPITLQRLWLFGESGEVYLWRDADEGQWKKRTTKAVNKNATADFAEIIEEKWLLYGTDPKATVDGFTIITDGSQGFGHAIPLPVKGKFNEQNRPLRLKVRHHLVEDTETGFNRTAMTTLAHLFDEKVKAK